MSETPASVERLNAQDRIRVMTRAFQQYLADHHQAATVIAQNAAQTGRQAKAKVDALVATDQALRERIDLQNQEAAVENQKLVVLEKGLSTLQQVAATLPRELQETQKEAAAKAKAVAEKKKGMEKVERHKEYALKELCKGVEYFEQNLGLVIETCSSGTLKFSFKYIDEKNPERVCFFHVHVNSQDKYQVGVCEPALAEVGVLCTRLNEDNNFSWFVQSMRRAFRRQCNAGPGKAVFS